MPEPLSRRADIALRWSFWVAAAAIVICIAAPDQLPDPRLDMSAVIHWIPASLIVWMIISSRLRKIGRTPRFADGRLSAPYPRRPDEV
jgi:hypothetical protein